MKNKYYTRKKVAFIVYEFDSFNNDFRYVKEYFKTQDIEKEYNIMNCRQYIAKNIDSIKHYINNKYIIIKEVI